jgi:hypothetical protein
MPYSFFDDQRNGQQLMLTSKDHLEGARSFVEKRAAPFKRLVKARRIHVAVKADGLRQRVSHA